MALLRRIVFDIMVDNMNQVQPGTAGQSEVGRAAQQPRWDWRQISPIDAGCLAIVTGALAIAYAPNILTLYQTSVREWGGCPWGR